MKSGAPEPADAAGGESPYATITSETFLPVLGTRKHLRLAPGIVTGQLNDAGRRDILFQSVCPRPDASPPPRLCAAGSPRTAVQQGFRRGARGGNALPDSPLASLAHPRGEPTSAEGAALAWSAIGASPGVSTASRQVGSLARPWLYGACFQDPAQTPASTSPTHPVNYSQRTREPGETQSSSVRRVLDTRRFTLQWET